MPQLPSKLYRIYIKHSLLFINLHMVSCFIQKQAIATSSQHLTYSPRIITRRYRNLLRYLLRNCIPDLLPGLSLTRLSIDRTSPEWQNESYSDLEKVTLSSVKNSTWTNLEAPATPFFAEESSAKPSLVTWLHRQHSSFTGRPDSQGSDFGLLQALPQVLPPFPVLWRTGTPSLLHFPYWPLLSAFPGKTSRLIATDVPCSGLYPVPRTSPTQLLSTDIQGCSGLPSTATSYWYSGTAA